MTEKKTTRKTPTKAAPTARGRAVSDAVVEKLAREAEQGFDVPKLKRAGGRKPLGSAAARVIPVTLDPELEAALKERADVEDSNISEVIREALRAWLRSA
jgi:hypothetical protein